MAEAGDGGGLPALPHSRESSNSAGAHQDGGINGRHAVKGKPGVRAKFLTTPKKSANGLPMLASAQGSSPKAAAKKQAGGAGNGHLQPTRLSLADQEVLKDARRKLRALGSGKHGKQQEAQVSQSAPSSNRMLFRVPSRTLSRVSSKSFIFAQEEGEEELKIGNELEEESLPPQLAEPTESELLNVAAKMGMCRTEEAPDMTAHARAPKIKKSSASLTSPSPLGVQFKVFESLLETVKDSAITTNAVVQSLIIPKTARHRSRYIDLLPEKFVDNPTIYVIHTWSCSFVETLTAVQEYVLNLRTNVDDVFVWMDVLCVNQHLDRSPGELPLIREILQGSERVVMLLDRHGAIFSRSWCLWEAMQAQTALGAWDKLVIIAMSWSWDDLLHTFQILDVSRAVTTKEKEATWLLTDLQRNSTVDVRSLNATLKDGMMTGAKREMNRSEKLASINSKRFIVASTAYGFMLFLACRYGEAETIIRQVLRVIDRAPSKEISDKEQAVTIYHLASILKEQGRLPDAERALQDFVNQFRGLQDELYMEGVAYLVEVLYLRKMFTKAEMLTHKTLEDKYKQYGKNHPFVARSLLQLSQISLSQKLYDECEGHAKDVIERLGHYPNGFKTQEMASAYQTLAICTFQGNRTAETKVLCEKALQLCQSNFGVDHPLSMDARALQAEIMIREKRFTEAEDVLQDVFKRRVHAYGQEHHTTLASMGHLSDLYRLVNKKAQSDEMDRLILQIGRVLLKASKIDKFQSLAYITTFLSKREHLRDKAAMFLAKAFTVFKHKLTNDHELVLMTRNQLSEIITKVKRIGADASDHAQRHDNANQYAVAEVMYKQAYSISKLVQPEDDHKPLAQSLADALFGQGKLQEGKTIMRVAGLTRKGMSQNMPASYLRWMNTRVAKYMDSKANTGMFDSDGEYDSA
eukprot:CAMPEP_0202399706 /NCGR_PEP_ID=MMETSP1128-20130828/2199_1 /ASSEMBLY_ACC=CAM_ASM_000463 /TAXON_ID=3047 /ORGANISM="Dunaliella tertiolecta, Strain CCMP1320" /LENGTH=919 /DNA_ID=CAMNT_0049003089 /DNA_START=134 /DNA_END=2893 /DNA_ORIENTATION=+